MVARQNGKSLYAIAMSMESDPNLKRRILKARRNWRPVLEAIGVLDEMFEFEELMFYAYVVLEGREE